jgi:hypothetical protein
MRVPVEGFALLAALLLPACSSGAAGSQSDPADDRPTDERAVTSSAGRLVPPSDDRPWIGYAEEVYSPESFAGVAREGDRYIVYRVPVQGVARLDATLLTRAPAIELTFADTEYALARLDALVQHIMFRDRAYWRGEGIYVEGAGIAEGPRVSVRVRDLRTGMAEAMRSHYSVASISLYEGEVVVVPPG